MTTFHSLEEIANTAGMPRARLVYLIKCKSVPKPVNLGVGKATEYKIDTDYIKKCIAANVAKKKKSCFKATSRDGNNIIGNNGADFIAAQERRLRRC